MEEFMETQTYTNQQLFSYAYLSTAFDLRRDIFKNYICLLEYFLLERNYQGKEILFEFLHQELNNFYKLQMPKATLQKLLKDMQRERKAKITGSGIIFDTKRFSIGYVDIRDSVDNEFQILFSHLQHFFTAKNISLELDQVKDIVLKFALSNSSVIIELYNNNSTPSSMELGEYESELVEYLFKIRDNDPEVYNTLIKITMGAIRTSILNLSPENIKDLNKDDVIVKTVILDTNFLLRLLNLQSKIDCRIASETHEILRKLNIECLVLEATISEAISSISNYLFQMDPITPYTRDVLAKNKIRLSGFLAAEQNGLSRSQILQYRDRNFMVQKIQTLGLKIVDFHLGQLVNEQDCENLIKEKNRDSYTTENATHDLTLIEYCSMLRNNKKYPVSQEKVWVLTNDSKLASWHKRRCNNFGYACITESQLMSYIWLLNGNTGIELNYAILALASKNAVNIDQVINFQKCYLDYVKRGDASSIKDLALIFASGDITNVDFVDVNDNETMESFMEQQLKEIQEKQKSDAQETERETKELQAQANSLQEKINNATQNLFLERQKLSEEYRKNSEEIKELEEKVSHNQEDIKKRKTLLSIFRHRGILVWGILFIVAAIGFCASYLPFKFLYKGDDKQEWIRIIVPIICTGGLPFILSIITTCIFGKALKFADTYIQVLIIFCKKKMRSIIGKSTSPYECKEEIKGLKDELIILETEITDKQVERGKIEYAIKRLEKL